jgi:predicted metal-binding membrane protein
LAGAAAPLAGGRPRLAPPHEREQWLLLVALLGFAVIGWIVSDERMGGMSSGPGMDLGGVGFFVTVWVVMMAAMMFPSVAPTVMLYHRLRAPAHGKPERAPREATVLFVVGYVAVWGAVGLLAYALLELLATIEFDAIAWDRNGPYVAGGVIVAAALYQLTPLKNVCLTHCRSPLMFLAEHWRNGRLGALRIGAEHGAWCVGCCWALMAALFAVGVMSLGWMAFVAALIAAEKLLPWRRFANLGVAAVLLVLGLAVAFFPEQVPGLMSTSDAATPGDGGMQMMR